MIFVYTEYKSSQISALLTKMMRCLTPTD